MVAVELTRAWARAVAAYKTVPPSLDPQAWVYVATFAAIVLPVGLLSGVLQLKVERRPAKWLEVFLVVFCSRGLAEELVFRVMALPHPDVDGPTPPAAFALRALISTVIFVAAHLLIPGERARATFWDPAFLAMASVFGALCSAVYYLTASLLVVWLVHCVPVAIWLLLLGGAEKVQ